MRRLCIVLSLVAAVLGAVSAQSLAAGPEYLLTDLGTLGGTSSVAYGVNANGIVVGRSRTSTGADRAFVWDSVNGMRNLGTFSGSGESAATAVNASGVVAGWAHASGGNRPFVWTQSTGLQMPTNIASDSSASAINSSGDVSGTYYAGSSYAFRSVNGAFQHLGTLGGTYSVAHGINDAGQIVGRSRNANIDDKAFLWDPGTGWHELPSSSYSDEAFDVNNLGTVVGKTYRSASPSGDRAALWDAAGIRLLGTLGAGESYAYAVNDSNRVVGEASFKAFIWDSTSGMRDLNSLITPGSGWTLRGARGISDNGLIVGWGAKAGFGSERAFLLTPVPEPAFTGLAAFAVVLLKRRKGKGKTADRGA
jgi:probable HAF family extracellular repeat protein